MIYTLADLPILAHLMDQLLKKSSLLSRTLNAQVQTKTVPLINSSCAILKPLFMLALKRDPRGGQLTGVCPFRPDCVSPFKVPHP